MPRLSPLRIAALASTLLSIAISGVQLSAASAMRQADATVYGSKDPGVTLPVVVQRVNAKYTDDARKRGVQGIIELEEVVTSTGDVREDVRVVKSLDPELDAQAVDAARQWHFRPGTKEGKPVNVRVRLEMSFRLK